MPADSHGSPKAACRWTRLLHTTSSRSAIAATTPQVACHWRAKPSRMAASITLIGSRTGPLLLACETLRRTTCRRRQSSRQRLLLDHGVRRRALATSRQPPTRGTGRSSLTLLHRAALPSPCPARGYCPLPRSLRRSWDVVRKRRYQRQRKMGLVNCALAPLEPKFSPRYFKPAVLDTLGRRDSARGRERVDGRAEEVSGRQDGNPCGDDHSGWTMRIGVCWTKFARWRVGEHADPLPVGQRH